MKIYKINSIEEIPNEDIGGYAFDMMKNKMDWALHYDNWDNIEIPSILYEINGIFGELNNKDVSSMYLKEKIRNIRWKIDSLNIPSGEKNLKAINNVKVAISQIVADTAQKMAVKRIMEGVLTGDKQSIFRNLDYLERWISTEEGGFLDNQNAGFPKY